MKMKKKWIAGISLFVGALLSTGFGLSLQTSKVDAYSAVDLEEKTLQAALALDNAFFIDGAQVRLKETENDKMGIRFLFKIDEAIFEKYLMQTDVESGNNVWKENVEIGTVWMPYDLLQGEELTLSTANVSKVPTEVTEWKNATKEIDGEEVSFMQSMTYMYDIPLESYHRNICVRGYVKEGENVYYTKLIGRSLSWVARQAILEDSAKYYETCKEYLRNHTATYYVDGEQYQDAATYQYGDNVSVDAVEAPEKAGYKFNGWYRDANCQNAWDFENDVVTGTTRLYAGWKAYEQKTNDEFVIFSDAEGFTYALDDTNTTGRDTAYKYYIPNNNWKARLELYETSTKKNTWESASKNNIRVLGYEWVVFDYYATATMRLHYPVENTASGKETESVHATVDLTANTFTANDYVKLYKDGCVADSFTYNEWYTVAVKLTGFGERVGGATSVALYHWTAGNTCWIDNIRYYYGDTFTAEYKYGTPVSMTEFSAVNSNLVSFGAETVKFDADLGAYHYQSTGTDQYEWNNRIVFATSPSTAVTNGYSYISFDIYVEENNFGAKNAGYVYLSGYTIDNSLKTAHLSNAGVGTATPDIFTPSDYIKLYANGEEVRALQTGGWTTVVVALEQLDNMVFYMGCRFGGEFWLKDVCFQTQADYQKDYNN